MKINKRSEQNVLNRAASDPDIYDAKISHGMTTLIDRHEFIVDIMPSATLKFVIPEADALIDAILEHWPDALDDIYYGQGEAIFPICSPDPEQRHKIEIYKWTPDVTIYRYQLAGEWIYGITNRYDPDEPPVRYVEGSLDGWERWLRDHKRVLQQVWIARNRY